MGANDYSDSNDTPAVASSGAPTSWTDPRYVSTVVGIVATGALYVHSALAATGPTAGEVTLVSLAVTGPMAVAHEVARRWLHG